MPFSGKPERHCASNPAVISPLVGLLALCFASATGAHHSARVTYDMDRIVELEGDVTRVVWRNPHVRFTLRVAEDGGSTTLWDIESIPVTRLARSGITAEVLSLGDTVRVAGFPARRPVDEVYAINLLLADGREVLLDTPVARWTQNTIGIGRDITPGTASADPSLGIFRVWSTDGSFLRSDADYPLTDAARAAQASWDPLSPDNPFLGCTPKGMPIIMQQPNPVEFVDRGDEILFRMEEFDTVRVISMGPVRTERAPTPLGHSSGRWEGNTLVVTTNGISWRHFDQNGLMQSEAMQTLERFTLNEEGSRLDYEVVVTDPWLFTEPVILRKSWRWVPGDEVLPFNCTD